MIGRTVFHYRILDEIGEAGTDAVYRAQHAYAIQGRTLQRDHAQDARERQSETVWLREPAGAERTDLPGEELGERYGTD